MTHRTLPLGSKGRWQYDNFPWVVKRMEACVMVLRPVKATQYLMCYSNRRRGGATYFGQMGEWLNPIDCKSIAQRATLVRT